MICKDCQQDLGLDRFPVSIARYNSKKGPREYVSIQSVCNRCQYVKRKAKGQMKYKYRPLPYVLP